MPVRVPITTFAAGFRVRQHCVHTPSRRCANTPLSRSIQVRRGGLSLLAVGSALAMQHTETVQDPLSAPVVVEVRTHKAQLTERVLLQRFR